MACRRSLRTLTRHTSAILTSKPHSPSLHHLKTLASQLPSLRHPHFHPNRSFTSRVKDNNNPPRIIDDVEQYNDDEDDDDDDDDDDGEEDYDDDDISDEESNGEIDGEDGSSSPVDRAYTVEDKIKEAADIGYKVVGPIKSKDRVFRPYEPVFAIFQIGSHQFKVSNGDWIYVEKLKFCDVNDKIILNKVLMVGSPTQTIIGRPILPDAAVHAVVEEHALDAKVIIFKKKRRKNYRRTNGHRQELTRLRIADIEGIEKPVTPKPSPSRKAVKTPSKKPAKEPVVT